MTQPAYPAPLPSRSRAHLGFFAAGGACFVLSFLLLMAGLSTTSLVLVYASIAASIIWLPLVIVGIVLLVRDSR